MNVCLAQVRSEGGRIQANVDHHMAVLRTLGPGQADLVAFPELSLANYDPDVAEAAAIEPDDDRLHAFQRFADDTGCAVAVGAPLRTSGRPRIGMLVFGAGRGPVVVGKRYLHADEASAFSASPCGVGVLDLAVRVGVAICYEIAVPEHAEAVAAAGAEVYLASVAKTLDGVAHARVALAETARRHALPALMVNSVGTCEGAPAGGGSMVLDGSGRLLAQLGATAEGLLVYDTERRTAAPVHVGFDAG